MGEIAIKWATFLVAALNRLLKLYPPAEHGLTEFEILDLIIPTLLGAPESEHSKDTFALPDSNRAAITPASQWFFSLGAADPARYSYRGFLNAFVGRWVPSYTRQLMRTRFFNGVVNVNDYRGYWNWFDTQLLTLSYLGETLTDAEQFSYAVNHFRNHTELWTRLFADLGGRDIQALRYVMQSQQQARDMLSRQGMGAADRGFRRNGRGSGTPPGYHHLEDVDDLQHAMHSIEEDDFLSFPEPDFNALFCNLCEIERDPNSRSDECVCLDAHFNEYEDHLSLEDYVDNLDAVYSAFTKNGPARGGLSESQRTNLVIDSTCRHCGLKGHFVRDCTKLGGTGHSTLGARYGSAKGFKEGDDPSLQPKAYKDARAKRLRKVAAIRSTVTSASNGNQRPRSRLPSKRQGGKFATHARRLRTGHATNPPTPRYFNCHLHGHYDLCWMPMATLRKTLLPTLL